MAKEEQLFQASNKFQQKSVVKDLFPLRDHVIATDMDFSGRKLSTGIVLLGDDGTTAGIRPRWCKVFRVGPEQKDVKIGQWILVEHGRWTRGLKIEMAGEEIIVRRIDTAAIIGVQDEVPDDDTLSTAVQAQKKTRD